MYNFKYCHTNEVNVNSERKNLMRVRNSKTDC